MNSSKTKKIILTLTLILFAIIGTLLLRNSSAAPFASGDADINGDGVVNILDLSLLLSQWNTSNPQSDINDDGSVNILDLSSLLSSWGETTSGDITIPVAGTWTNATSNLSGMQSECGTSRYLSPVPGSDRVIAGVAGRGLWATDNEGSSWTALGAGPGSDVIDNRPAHIVHDPVDPDTFWVSGAYGGGVFKTTDAGETFERLGSITHVDYVSVDFGDPNRSTLIAGGHEQSQRVYKSTDGGQNWVNIGLNLPADTAYSRSPIIIDNNTYVVNTAPPWRTGTKAIFRTTDGGQTWSIVHDVSTHFRSPLVTSGGDIYWSHGRSLARSTDGGLTWAQVGNNLSDLPPAELPDGRLVSVTVDDRLTISSDKGATWTDFGTQLPYEPYGVIYQPTSDKFYIWRWDCSSSVPSNAIMRLDP